MKYGIISDIHGNLEALKRTLTELEGVSQIYNLGDIVGYHNANECIELLKSIPGIGTFTAFLVKSEIDDIERFASKEKLSSYAGLIPSTHSSGARLHHGRIVKQGNKDWIIDIRSPAKISDFNYSENNKIINFSFDKPTYIILYVPKHLLPNEMTVTVNGIAPKLLEYDNNYFDENIFMIRMQTEYPGIVEFTPV